MKLRRFAVLTICASGIFAVTMTFAPVLPRWLDYAARCLLLLVLGVLLWLAPRSASLSRFRPVFFAYFTAVLSQSLGYFLADPLLKLLGLTTQTPVGVAIAKFFQAFIIVVAILASTRAFGQNLASLYLRKGRLLFGVGVGSAAAAACLFLSLQQPAIRNLGTQKLVPLIPWILLFVLSNAFMEELFFRGLFLGRYEVLMGSWPAIFSTGFAFSLAHMQVTYAPDIFMFLAVTLVLSIAWGWLMQKTGSIWGSALFHAGADLLIILPIFRSLGAS